MTHTTSGPPVGGQTDVNDECDSDGCDTYVTRWVDFYLNVSKKRLFFYDGFTTSTNIMLTNFAFSGH